MRKRLRPEALPAGPHPDAHGRAAVHLHGVQQGSHHQALAAGAHEPALRYGPRSGAWRRQGRVPGQGITLLSMVFSQSQIVPHVVSFKGRLVYLSEGSLEFCPALSLKLAFTNWPLKVQCIIRMCLSTSLQNYFTLDDVGGNLNSLALTQSPPLPVALRAFAH